MTLSVFAALGKAEPLISTTAGQKFTLTPTFDLDPDLDLKAG